MKLTEIKPKDWDKWLEDVETYLKDNGYRKYNQGWKRENFAYWKSFEGYQVGVFFYDFRKYDEEEGISIQYECMLISKVRIDLSVFKDIQLEEFEKMSEDFYQTMKKYL